MAESDNDVPSHGRAREPNGHFAAPTFEAVYDSLRREVKRIAELRDADQLAVQNALTAAEKAVAAALAAAEKAVTKAEVSQSRVNEGQNEFRGQLKDQAAQLMPRSESELITSSLRDQMADLRSRLDVGPLGMQALQRTSDKGEGRREGSVDTRNLVIALAGIALAVAAYLAGGGGP